jgi:predicted tellurium resistance membrane protein TerC
VTGSVAAAKTVSDFLLVFTGLVVAVMVIWAVVSSLAFLAAKLRGFG